MRSDLLDVVAVYANPIRWQNRKACHDAFEQHMLNSGVRLTTVECAYGERPWELPDHPHINRVRVRSKTLVWNKECLTNIGITRLPHDWRYLGWIDADLTFRKASWASDAAHALQQYDVIQPWSDAYDLGPNGEHLQAHRSFCRQFWHNEPVTADGPTWWTFDRGPYHYAHPGYAWCATRQAIDWVGGLIETAAAGSGDHHMAMAMVGKGRRSAPRTVADTYLRPILKWEERAVRHINGNIGFTWGTIEHSWHGRKSDRRYIDRWSILTKHKFCPDNDLKRNSWGVLELSGGKPELRRDLDHYFRQRNEDANSIG